MQFHDLRKFHNEQSIDADICIVGSGPAGLTIAGEFANTDKSVWIIESGGKDIDKATQELYQFENKGVQRCISQKLIRIRSYGGTSALWSGRVAPFDEVDFSKREWVNHSGWPIQRNELEPYFEKAGKVLSLGPNLYDERLWEKFDTSKPFPQINPATLKSQFWQFSRSRHLKNEPTRFAVDFEPKNSKNLNILLYANLTRINTIATDDSQNQVESLDVSSLEGVTARVNAKLIILCCGGIENARLLLASNHQHPTGIGNQNDMVGRFFMDHPYCELGEFNVKQSKKLLDRFSHFWLDDDDGRHVYLHGLSLSKEIQKKEKLLNCSVYLITEESLDSSWLTAKRALMSLKAGKLNLIVIKDIFKVLRSFDKFIDGFFRRYFKNRPPLIQSRRIALGCNVEQLPDPDSRIILSKKRDALNMPLACIDWKISEEERNTILRMVQLINTELPAIDLPQLNVAKWLNEDVTWRDNFFDVAHHIGSTRMAKAPEHGVVDENCKVHSVKGLYVAGSSVFPTSGTANPMLMITSLAIRLADHLKSLAVEK